MHTHTQLLAKLKEKGPPKTLCKNLPKRDAGEQTPFGIHINNACSEKQ